MDDELTPTHEHEAEPAEAEVDPEVVSLREALELREADLAAANESSRLAVERLRSALLALEPALTAEMVAGDTVDELEASFDSARETLGRMRETVRREQALPVGAGAPDRHTAGPLTPRRTSTRQVPRPAPHDSDDASVRRHSPQGRQRAVGTCDD
jgi:hypothetical protein